MIDFIEYVIAELKSKRLSKTDAVALVRQFSLRGSNSSTGAVLHPLLQFNRSNLIEQRYTSMFTGQEFFLAGHRVATEGEERKVLPGVAYLEMARAAMEQALPRRGIGKVLELKQTIWVRPITVDGKKRDVSI